jgi:hypothetical protein
LERTIRSSWCIWARRASSPTGSRRRSPQHLRALTLARDRGERGHEAWALRLLGEIASHPGRPDVATAEAHYGAAMALATELGMRPLVAHCHLGLATVYRRTGDRAKTEEHLTTASALYREMDMGFWLEKAEAALGPPRRNSP